MEVHEAAKIFPIDEEHIDELSKDIAKNGLREPLKTLGGKLIDGRRRMAACVEANVKPKFESIETDDPIAYVLSLNLHRRHLSPTQLSMVGARAREIYDRQAKERQKLSKGQGIKGPVNFPDVKGDARDAVGKAMGVSGKSIDHATKILEQGTPELIAAVDADKIAVSTAARVAGMSDAEQNALVKRANDRAANGHKAKVRPSVPRDDEPESNGDVKGKGVILAHEAINCLIRIPKSDPLRKRGFQIVMDWIKANR